MIGKLLILLLTLCYKVLLTRMAVRYTSVSEAECKALNNTSNT